MAGKKIIKELSENFIRVVPSKEKEWITDVYYGTTLIKPHGHLVASGAVIISGAFVSGANLVGIECEEPLYHRNANNEILFDTGIMR